MYLEHVALKFERIHQRRGIKYLLGKPAFEDEISQAEENLKISFPDKVILFYRHFNGLRVENPAFGPLVVPLSLIILLGVFMLQSRGTGRLGVFFGPIMIVWFATLAFLGGRAILDNPQIFHALNPYYGVYLFIVEPWAAFVALGSQSRHYAAPTAAVAKHGALGMPLTIADLGAVPLALVVPLWWLDPEQNRRELGPA
jgi:hypothetical protein